MRLNKYLASAGVASRRRADELIQAATTTVNGRVVVNPATQVDMQDKVCFNGKHVYPIQDTIIIMLHKPAGVITSVGDPKGRPTVTDFVSLGQRLFPVGRLDKDTTGLLLLTNDGELTQSLLHPSRRLPRVYVAVIDKPLTRSEFTKLRKGIHLGKKVIGRATVLKQKSIKGRTQVTLELREGKNREIRRMMMRLKRRLFSLHRTQFGSLKLANLGKGKWRELKKSEISQLKNTDFSS